MKGRLRQLYLGADQLIFSRLTAHSQLRIKRLILRVGRLLFPNAISPLLTAERMVTQHVKPLTLPAWAIEEMAQVAKAVDPQLEPQRFLSRRPQTHHIPQHRVNAGAVYFGILSRIKHPVDVIVLVPTMGHDDLAEIQQAISCARTLIVSTDISPLHFDFDLDFPDEIQLVDAGMSLNGILEPADAIAVLARLVLQLKPNLLKVINAGLGMETVARHGQALAQVTRVLVSERLSIS